MSAIKQALLMMEELDELLNGAEHWEQTEFARAILIPEEGGIYGYIIHVYATPVDSGEGGELVYVCLRTEMISGDGEVTTTDNLDDIEQFLVDHGFVGEEEQ